jgi:ribosome biogenesis GTPase
LKQRLDGVVIKQQSGFFTVQTDAGVFVTQLRGRIKEEMARRVRKEEEERSDLCALGDRVTVEVQDDGKAVIDQIHPRERVLSRADHTGGPNEATQRREQVIIANADQAIFVLAASHPTPNPRVLDRLIVAAEKGQIPQIRIVCNKIDRVQPGEAEAVFGMYEQIGYPVLYTSAPEQIGIETLRGWLTGHISVFTGPSGVGKTSLLNAVQAGLGLRVSEVSTATTKGRHTTVHSELFPLDGGGFVADTPGIRGIAVWDVEPMELEAYYIDIAPYVADCQFADCTHTHEPGCAVRDAVRRGDIHIERYKSFLRLRRDIEETYEDWV